MLPLVLGCLSVRGTELFFFFFLPFFNFKALKDPLRAFCIIQMFAIVSPLVRSSTCPIRLNLNTNEHNIMSQKMIKKYFCKDIVLQHKGYLVL